METKLEMVRKGNLFLSVDLETGKIREKETMIARTYCLPARFPGITGPPKMSPKHFLIFFGAV